MYAALIAIINGNLADRVGYLNPWFYTVAQQAGQLVFSDVNDGGTNAQTVTVAKKAVSIPGYQCGAGWDPVTGWGSIDGVQLQNKLAVYFARTCSFSIRKNTFGHDEVDLVGKRVLARRQATALAASRSAPPHTFYVCLVHPVQAAC